MDHDTSDAPGGWRLSTSAVEIGVALITLALGVLVTYTSWQLGARWAEDGPQAGYFPFYVGLLVCIGSLVNLAGGVRARLRRAERTFVEWEPLKRIISVVLPAAVFVGGIHIVGIYVSALCYIAFFMMWIGKYSWHKGLTVGFGVSFVMFLMFEVWFQVLLPKGEYNVLSFFGY